MPFNEYPFIYNVVICPKFWNGNSTGIGARPALRACARLSRSDITVITVIYCYRNYNAAVFQGMVITILHHNITTSSDIPLVQ